MRLGQALLASDQRTSANLGLLQRSLMKDHFEQAIPDLLGQRVRAVRRLGSPDSVELLFQHLAIRIKIITVSPCTVADFRPQARAHARDGISVPCCRPATMQILAERRR